LFSELQHLQSPLLALWVDTFRLRGVLFVGVVGEVAIGTDEAFLIGGYS
jgi:hypothetical protein